MPAVAECTAHCPPFGKRELARFAGQSSASHSIAPINSNENFVILKTGSINGLVTVSLCLDQWNLMRDHSGYWQ